MKIGKEYLKKMFLFLLLSKILAIFASSFWTGYLKYNKEVPYARLNRQS